MTSTVTICIPTYQSETFIARTLACARAQTHRDIRIVVSVDRSTDRTVDVCRDLAREDSRIRLLVQEDRLGWSRNANAALDCIDTEYGFLYFHDDIIEPTYVERLLAALHAAPEAASAHCDLVEFGLAEQVRPAHSYDGTPLRRLIDFMMTRRGTTLRSLIRWRDAARAIRFPQIHGDNHWAANVFHLRLLAAGPAVAVHEPLYRRWQREGSLTRSSGWQPADLEAALRGQREAATLCLEIIEAAAITAEERLTGLYCLRLFHLLDTRHQQLRMNDFQPVDGADIAAPLATEAARLVPAVLDPEALAWVTDVTAQLAQLDLAVASRLAQAGPAQI